ncbi:Predicted nucleotidyltransferase component of viral defense system [Granulicatella balaenopterae]|uniref:Predicted nucleotidyltransferase component of viral defense system n=1 Tax=Granulicatella balaenopterae TaxID=137733 RepID=A0A1H9MTE1_9LACT|nr:nucleotidyl transferase AbiEii/AbiGii toxin family protein [Granulicatella balaenopterae]SER26952.1 Predicted nucleotidyltransferase component of viral defense system [Granulicatella balaenopterae]
MKTPEQIKGAIRNISKKSGTNLNSLLQMYLFEGILEKLSKSDYKNKFIIKGGLLVSSLIGVNMRSTMDMDTTIKGIPVNEETITNIINEILSVPIDSDIHYELKKLTPIREKDIYEDFCANIICTFGKIRASLYIDITTGDVITPREMKYSYPRIFDEDNISIMSYTIETILAEKFETISSRNIFTTRARDFYDLYMLFTVYKDKLDSEILRNAILNTSEHRGSLKAVKEYKNITEMLLDNPDLNKFWEKYIKTNIYAKDVNFKDTVLAYKEIGDITKL